MEIDNIRNSIKKYYPVTDKSIDLFKSGKTRRAA